MQALTAESLDGFFDAHVQQLQEKGVFRTYDQPKGEALENVPNVIKSQHGYDPAFPAGVVRHVGDMTHNAPLTSGPALHRPISQINQQAMRLNTASVQEAIGEYVPLPSFVSYLRYFAENLDKPEIQGYLQVSLQNCKRQFSSTVNEKVVPPEILEKMLSIPTIRGRMQDEDIMAELEQQTSILRFEDGSLNPEFSLRWVNVLHYIPEKVLEHPEYLLSAAIFQGAHIGYRAELESAIERQYKAGALTNEEHANASATVREALRQFNSFLIFGTLTPLVMHEYDKLPKEAEHDLPAQNSPEGMRHAISKGWERFFEARVLNSVVSTEVPQGGTPEDFKEKRINAVCPAKQHLAKTQKAGVLEMVFDSVVKHKDELKPYLDYTEALAAHALDSQKPEPQSIFTSPAYEVEFPSLKFSTEEWDLGKTCFSHDEAKEIYPVLAGMFNVLKWNGAALDIHERPLRVLENIIIYGMAEYTLSGQDADIGYVYVNSERTKSIFVVDKPFLNIENACALIDEQLKKLPQLTESIFRTQLHAALPERAKGFLPKPPQPMKVKEVKACVPALMPPPTRLALEAGPSGRER